MSFSTVVIGFLNERSLEPYADWGAALRLFLVAAQELPGSTVKLFKDSNCFVQGGFLGGNEKGSGSGGPIRRRLGRRQTFFASCATTIE